MEQLGKEIDKLANQLTELRWEIWLEHTVFTWQWWMLLGICMILPVLFFIFIKREHLLSAFAYLGVIFILNKTLDDVATAMDWYDYRIQLEPIIPTMLPANLFIVPMSLSIIYQRFERWNSFLIAVIVFAGFISFISLPLMELADIYLPKKWNSLWSFATLVTMAVMAKLIIDRLTSLYRPRSHR